MQRIPAAIAAVTPIGEVLDRDARRRHHVERTRGADVDTGIRLATLLGIGAAEGIDELADTKPLHHRVDQLAARR